VINFGRTIPIGAAWLRTAHGRLMLTVLGGLAEFERELILTRTSDGRTRAKARGVKFGRPPSLTAHQRQEVIERLAKGEAQADIARSYAGCTPRLTTLIFGCRGTLNAFTAVAAPRETRPPWTRHHGRDARPRCGNGSLVIVSRNPVPGSRRSRVPST
jgi:hypothetical protein